MPKKPSYSQKMGTIRDFVTFNFKAPERLGRRNKVKLTKYYNFLLENAEKYRALEPPEGDFSQIQVDTNPTFQRIPKRIKKTEFKVLFLPVNKFTASVEYDKKRKKWAVVEKTPLGKRRDYVVLFKDLDALAQNPKAYVDRLVKSYPKNALFRVFNPQGWQSQTAYDKEGRIVSSGGLDKGLIGGEVERLMNLYPTEGESYLMGLAVSIGPRMEREENLALIGEAEYRGRKET